MRYGIRPRGPDTVHDHEALDEIELYAEVLIAVAGADRRLTPEEIDRVLGVSPADLPGRPPPGAAPSPRSPQRS
ncbi:hypothetical protein [Nocardiopsis algeriensis]|uniref:Tellurite resistance protein TerB n=1 Tax=Nocardiopsis algeriensis TaxID=1478215 RepID=A0A841IQ67_9ACTN|nr:hypothetical protein [Nocardiopsis algeriensis]MBB6118398.1 hypothetical protein [Nocardiopsis algeriensis]